MRNPKSLCAVALALALTSPASSAPPATVVFNPKDWDVVIPAGPAEINAIVSKVCPGPEGYLASKKTSVSEAVHSVWNHGFNVHVDLACVTFIDEKNVDIKDVDKTVLELTVYHGPWTGYNQFVLNRSPKSPEVMVHEPTGPEMTYVPPKTQPAPPSTEPGRPKPKKPAEPPVGKNPPVHKPGTVAAAPLSDIEHGWLIPTERFEYDAAADAKPPVAANLVQAINKAREAIEKNLRPEMVAPYKALVAAGKFNEIDALLKNQFYHGLEVHLSDEEHTALAAIVKGKDHPDFNLANAQLEYDAVMKPLTENGKPKASEHVLAHQITEKFRAMIPKPHKPDGTDSTGAPVKLTDADLANLTPAERIEYGKKWDALNGDKAKEADLNKEYLAKNAAAKPAGGPAAPPVDPSTIKTLNDLKKLSDVQQKQYCSMLSTDGGGLAGCGDILANADAALAKCSTPPGVPKTAETVHAQSSCVEKINACKSQPAAKSSKVDSSKLPDDLRQYCATLLASTDKTPPVVGSGSKTSAVDKNPCPGSAPKDGDKSTDAAAPKPGDTGAKASTDVNPCKKPEDSKPDPNFYTNLGNGIAFGIGGLVLASFLGGPLLMAGFALAAGVGAYYVSKSITDPPPAKKDKKDS